MTTTKTTATAADRRTARFVHKIDRQWQKGAPAPMPKHWRTVCGLALSMAPRSAADPKFHRALVAALRFATPRRTEQTRDVRELDEWSRDPRNVAALAVDLLPVIRAHARA